MRDESRRERYAMAIADSELEREIAELREEIGGTDGTLCWGMHADVAEAAAAVADERAEKEDAENRIAAALSLIEESAGLEAIAAALRN